MSTPAIFALALALLYGLFVLWYGGRGKPLRADEVELHLTELAARLQAGSQHGPTQATLDDLRQLLANDDGREFVMQNLVRYRQKALYPPGSAYGDDPRAADRRYGRLILWPLLKRASLVMFVAPRSGQFLQPVGADDWHYVAMVRYRSRRDFLRFACEIERGDIVMHKWAAIEKTQVFPVQPIVSLFLVRTLVALVLAVPMLLLLGVARG